MFYDLTNYQFPKFLGAEGFPTIVDIDDDGNYIIHPVVNPLKEGSKIESVEIGDYWTADLEVCCDVAVVVDGKKYGFSAWWLPRKWCMTLVHAERGFEPSINDLVKYICSQVEDL